MKAYRMTAEVALIAFQIFEEFNLQSEAERTAVLDFLDKQGHIQSVTATKMTKDEYIEHVAKHLGNVLVIKEKKDASNSPS